MPQTIDVTGLTPEQVREIERTVESYRARAAAPPPAPAEEPKAFWTGPVPSQDSPDWINWLRAWSESHPRRVVEIDDDRGSIYDRDTP